MGTDTSLPATPVAQPSTPPTLAPDAKTDPAPAAPVAE